MEKEPMKPSWKDQKEHVYLMVKLLSDKYEGDHPEFLKKYCDEIIEKYKNDLSIPLKCFESLCKNYKIKIEKVMLSEKEYRITCRICGYRPIFCKCIKLNH